MKTAPYPSDTRAKGWRFELDMERARQSDTWTLAPSEVRPWLLMLWATAWEQTPCGSMPDDDVLIAARIGMPSKLFAKHKAILMRKWWKADDGRLYHDVLVQRVTEMLGTKRKEADRKAAYREKKDAERRGGPPPATPMSHGTDAGQTRQSSGFDDTGTGTGTSIKTGGADTSRESVPPGTEGHTPTPAGLVCRAMKSKGMADVNPGDPRLLELLKQGATVEEFEGAASEAVKRSKGFAYALGTLTGQRADAARLVLAPTVEDATPWHESRKGIEGMGMQLGIGAWDESAAQLGRGPQWPSYQAQVFKAAGHEQPDPAMPKIIGGVLKAVPA